MLRVDPAGCCFGGISPFRPHEKERFKEADIGSHQRLPG